MAHPLARGTVKTQHSNGRTGRSEKGNVVDVFGWMVRPPTVQGGPVPPINGVVTPINGLIKRVIGVITPSYTPTCNWQGPTFYGAPVVGKEI